MQIVGRVFKEIIIAILLLGVVFLAGFLLFRNQISFLSSDVPHPVSYKGIEYGEYDIDDNDTLEDQKDPTKVYQATTGSLKDMEYLRKVHTGTPNPFSEIFDYDKETDIPSETVDIENATNSATDVAVTTEDGASIPVSSDGASATTADGGVKALE